ncbi:isocitrate lyase/PEP mutase family protein [Streptantibioticus cattleyicolor]|uniref:PEP phosphonomutase-like protein n=1 Tax=Streptantibioticus cattleyicolor (strain ATCC 35852 / DSM 46488 / JCM 4925 / NBRC 14057 / NRRL 8057) TaxID=1003195 RepID=G8XGX3_STREN|nr:isocitrate lyase/phosphoenolpyruvate mutase family protein [Streptantibioticus cattleyicolor]AEW98800.1 PEP phosphonomutase-like protein [Streptantibioticus cattleyicolor NRRL 8057 = DSM 46488]
MLPNAWDVASAAMPADAGFAAIGTTSLGVAATAGIPDAAGLARAETPAVAARVVRLGPPVTVDVEGGFSEDPGEVADLVVRLAKLGVAGVDVEDGRPGGVLASRSHQCAVIAAIRSRAPGVFVNARTDAHWLGGRPDPAAALDRIRAYADAGADGAFVPGPADDAGIAEVAAATPLPVNVLFDPARHTVDRLAGSAPAPHCCGRRWARRSARRRRSGAGSRCGEPVRGAGADGRYAGVPRGPGDAHRVPPQQDLAISCQLCCPELYKEVSPCSSTPWADSAGKE